jgi:hypothetical protein
MDLVEMLDSIPSGRWKALGRGASRRQLLHLRLGRNVVAMKAQDYHEQGWRARSRRQE